MPVLYKRIHTQHKDFVTRTKCFYYNPVNAKRARGIRLCKTGEKKQERNKHNAYLKRKYELYNNFDKGDWWITLTERDNIDGAAANKNMTHALDLVRKACKRRGIPFVYYAKTEAGGETVPPVRAHHHLIIKNTDPAIMGLIMTYWQQYGNVSAKQIYSIEDGKLITYFLDGGDHKGLDYEKYSHSRNLEQPVIETRIYPYDSFRANPRPPKGTDEYRYEVRNLYNGFPDRDGFIYQEYELVRVAIRERE